MHYPSVLFTFSFFFFSPFPSSLGHSSSSTSCRAPSPHPHRLTRLCRPQHPDGSTSMLASYHCLAWLCLFLARAVSSSPSSSSFFITLLPRRHRPSRALSRRRHLRTRPRHRPPPFWGPQRSLIQTRSRALVVACAIPPRLAARKTQAFAAFMDIRTDWTGPVATARYNWFRSTSSKMSTPSAVNFSTITRPASNPLSNLKWELSTQRSTLAIQIPFCFTPAKRQSTHITTREKRKDVVPDGHLPEAWIVRTSPVADGRVLGPSVRTLPVFISEQSGHF